MVIGILEISDAQHLTAARCLFLRVGECRGRLADELTIAWNAGRSAWCGGFEIRLISAINTEAYFKSENHTRNLYLPVTPWNLKFVQNVLKNETNFRIG